MGFRCPSRGRCNGTCDSAGDFGTGSGGGKSCLDDGKERRSTESESRLVIGKGDQKGRFYGSCPRHSQCVDWQAHHRLRHNEGRHHGLLEYWPPKALLNRVRCSASPSMTSCAPGSSFISDRNLVTVSPVLLYRNHAQAGERSDSALGQKFVLQGRRQRHREQIDPFSQHHEVMPFDERHPRLPFPARSSSARSRPRRDGWLPGSGHG